MKFIAAILNRLRPRPVVNIQYHLDSIVITTPEAIIVGSYPDE